MMELISFTLSLFLIRLYIPLARKLGIGQLIKREGPDLHGYKEGTPTMAGIVFLSVSLALSTIHGTSSFVILSTLSFMAIGMLDDLVSVEKRDAYGMRARLKLILQVLVATVLVFAFGKTSSEMLVPFLNTTLDIGWAYPVLAVFLLVGSSNAVNLTDGLDGLASWIFLTGAVPMYFVTAGRELLIFSSSVLAFLIFNTKPAKVFMGDAGALGLGAFLASIAMETHTELFLPFFGLIFVVNTVSVMIQVISYKTTGRRVFKMAPLHHHFELSGWSEERVVFMFATLNLLSSVVTLGGSR